MTQTTALKSLLVNPFIEIVFDENHRWQIPATRSACKQMVAKWEPLKAQIEAMTGENPHEQLDAVKAGLQLLCGTQIGDEIISLCLSNLTKGGEVPEEEVVYYLIPVLEHIASLWVKQLDAMGAKTQERANHYLGLTDNAI